MKKTFILSLLIIGNSFLDACSPDDTENFKIDLTVADNFSLAGYNNIAKGSSIAAENYAIQVQGNRLEQTSFLQPSYGGKLMADIAFALVDPVTNISITSNSALGQNSPAGSELKELFAPLEIAAHCIENPAASNDCEYDYLTYSYINSLEEAFNQEMAVGYLERPGGARLFALQPTEAIVNNPHVFTLRFDFQSGKSMELSTAAVSLQ